MRINNQSTQWEREQFTGTIYGEQLSSMPDAAHRGGWEWVMRACGYLSIWVRGTYG